MKNFKEQIEECNKEGFRDFLIKQPVSLNLIPFCPAKAKTFIDSKTSFIEFVLCGRFGEACNSGQPKCKSLRNELCGTDMKIQ
jgi:hypothetical protein